MKIIYTLEIFWINDNSNKVLIFFDDIHKN